MVETVCMQAKNFKCMYSQKVANELDLLVTLLFIGRWFYNKILL